eukprot:5857195-Pleurochrysis_carterae.AAC.1
MRAYVGIGRAMHLYGSASLANAGAGNHQTGRTTGSEITDTGLAAKPAALPAESQRCMLKTWGCRSLASKTTVKSCSSDIQIRRAPLNRAVLKSRPRALCQARALDTASTSETLASSVTGPQSSVLQSETSRRRS